MESGRLSNNRGRQKGGWDETGDKHPKLLSSALAVAGFALYLLLPQAVMANPPTCDCIAAGECYSSGYCHNGNWCTAGGWTQPCP